MIRGLLSNEEWACLEPFVIEWGVWRASPERSSPCSGWDFLGCADRCCQARSVRTLRQMEVDLPQVPALGVPIAFALTGGVVSDYKGYLTIMNADGPALEKLSIADERDQASP